MKKSITKYNIGGYIAYLYQIRYSELAPAELIKQWEDIPISDLKFRLDDLYRHWQLSPEQSGMYEEEFLDLKQNSAEAGIVEPEVIEELKVKKTFPIKRIVGFLVLLLLLLGGTYILSNYSYEKSDRNDLDKGFIVNELKSDKNITNPVVIHDTFVVSKVEKNAKEINNRIDAAIKPEVKTEEKVAIYKTPTTTSKVVTEKRKVITKIPKKNKVAIINKKHPNRSNKVEKKISSQKKSAKSPKPAKSINKDDGFKVFKTDAPINKD